MGFGKISSRAFNFPEHFNRRMMAAMTWTELFTDKCTQIHVFLDGGQSLVRQHIPCNEFGRRFMEKHKGSNIVTGKRNQEHGSYLFLTAMTACEISRADSVLNGNPHLSCMQRNYAATFRLNSKQNVKSTCDQISRHHFLLSRFPPRQPPEFPAGWHRYPFGWRPEFLPEAHRSPFERPRPLPPGGRS
jgi:hypothetical protein